VRLHQIQIATSVKMKTALASNATWQLVVTMIEKRIDGTEKAPWLRCRGCRKSYWAENWHCRNCHETFTTYTSWHIADNNCIPATRMGWELLEDVWTPK
jgi:hypothetical protein